MEISEIDSEQALVAVTYLSHSLIKLSDVESQCEEIRQTASRNNAAQEISGLLLHCRNRFIQRLEGRKGAIDSLLETIKQDKRHRKFTILHYGNIDKRCFADWDQMRVISDGERFDELDQLFVNLESGGREILDDRESRFILNFIQHFKQKAS